jgi:homopolymeric O-antigen transport system permease protein
MTSASAAPAVTSQIVIEATSGWGSLRLGELWHHRELLYFLAWRDIKVRYKQTVLGIAWAVLQPLLTMLVFTIFFGRLARIGSEGVPYPLFSYIALIPWTFFTYGLTQSSNSLVGTAHLITKVYFPRLVIPIAAVLSGLVDSLLALLLVAPMLAYYGVAPSPAVLLLPVFLLLAFATALGAGLWLSALNVEYRDIHHIVPFFAQLWLFVTPVIYPASSVTGKLKALGLPDWLVGLNPMSGVVGGFRWALLGTPTCPISLILASAIVALALLISGAFYFRRMERTFADLV